MAERVICDYLNKGGSWKTLFSDTIPALTKVEHGKRVCVVDCDQQADLTTDNGVDVVKENRKTLEDLITGKADLDETIIQLEQFDLIPSPPDLRLGDSDLFVGHRAGKEYVLKELLEPLLERYDYIFLDVGTGLTLITVNALVFSTEVVFPVIPNKNAIKGMKEAYKGIQIIKKRLNPDIKISGIAISKVPKIFVTGIDKQLNRIMEFSQAFEIPIYKSVIRHSFTLEDGEDADGNDINPLYALKNADLLNDFRELTREIIAGE